MVVTVVLALLATSLTGTERSNEPVNRPKQEHRSRRRARWCEDRLRRARHEARPSRHPGPHRRPVRPLRQGKVDTGRTYVNMDVTDDGFAWTKGRGEVWFSDGTGVERIGSRACTSQRGWLVTFDTAAVVSGNAGSLLAWFDCADRRHPSLVVYDTGNHPSGRLQQVARGPMPLRPARSRPPCVLRPRGHRGRPRVLDRGGPGGRRCPTGVIAPRREIAQHPAVAQREYSARPPQRPADAWWSATAGRRDSDRRHRPGLRLPGHPARSWSSSSWRRAPASSRTSTGPTPTRVRSGYRCSPTPPTTGCG